MKKIIIYLSIHHQNTKKVVDYLAKKYQIKKIDLSVASFASVVNEIKKNDLVIFASGIYFGKRHQLLLKLVDQLPKLNNKKAVILSTACLLFLKFLWHQALSNKLKEKGFNIVGESCLPSYDTFGFLKFFGGINKGRPMKKILKKFLIFSLLLYILFNHFEF